MPSRTALSSRVSVLPQRVGGITVQLNWRSNGLQARQIFSDKLLRRLLIFELHFQRPGPDCLAAVCCVCVLFRHGIEKGVAAASPRGNFSGVRGPLAWPLSGSVLWIAG